MKFIILLLLPIFDRHIMAKRKKIPMAPPKDQKKCESCCVKDPEILQYYFNLLNEY